MGVTSAGASITRRTLNISFRFCSICLSEAIFFGCNLSDSASSVLFSSPLLISSRVSVPNSTHSKLSDIPSSAVLTWPRNEDSPNKEAIVPYSFSSQSLSACFKPITPLWCRQTASSIFLSWQPMDRRIGRLRITHGLGSWEIFHAMFRKRKSKPCWFLNTHPFLLV